MSQTWDYVADFSSSANPNGAWSYGYMTAIGSPFGLYTESVTDSGIHIWRSDSGYSTGGLFCDSLGVARVNVDTQWWEASMGAGHPGPDGALPSARWTAPSNAIVRVAAHFTGQSIAGGGTTTDVHVLKNGSSLFVGDIDGFAGRAENAFSDSFGTSPRLDYSDLIQVNSGDTLDFCLGYGANANWGYDITGLAATITDIPDVGLVKGTILGGPDGTTPLAGARVEVLGGAALATTGADGSYYLTLPAGTYTLHASYATNVPRESLVSVVEDVLVTCDFVLPETGNAYYVSPEGNDSNDGRSPERAWKTISRGDVLGVLAPGDTVYVAEGIYAPADGLGVSLLNCGGITDAPVTYRASGRVVIDQSSAARPASEVCGFRVEKSFIQIDGFEFIGSQWGVRVAGSAANVVVSNCLIHDSIPADPGASDIRGWCGGVYTTSSGSVLAHHSTCYSIGSPASGKISACVLSSGTGAVAVHNNTFDGAWSGVYVTGSSVRDVRNNVITGMWGYGLLYSTVSPTGSTHGYNLFNANAVDYGGQVARSAGEFNADPGFVDRSNHNYWLSSGSAAKDSGIDLGYPFIGAAPDLGAFEGGQETPVASLSELRSLPVETSVRVTQPQVVTVDSDALVGGSFCVEDPDRVCAIRIANNWGLPTLQLGDRITFKGVVTEAGGERVVQVTSVTSRIAGQPLRPLGMSGASVNSSTGIDTTALLVRVWGQVTEKADGYIRVADGSTPGGVRIALDRQNVPISGVPVVGQFAAITGVVSRAMEGSSFVRAVCPRSSDDVTCYHQSQDEAARREAWVGTYFGPASTQVPFSFRYDGQAFSDLMGSWARTYETEDLDDVRTQTTITYTSPTGVEARCVAVEYADFPTVEWTVYLKNNGATDTPIIENILGIDTSVVLNEGGDYVLHHNTGTLVNRFDYQPLDTLLGANSNLRFAPPGGRPCGTVFPYYNLEREGEGAIIVVGWPGQWFAQFSRDTGTDVHIKAGQEQTHLKLHPGEQVRTPLIVMQFWNDDRARSQNVWRRWMLAHNTPKPGGQIPQPQMPAVSGNQFYCLKCDEVNEKLYIDGYVNRGIYPDIWWMDAGWYWCDCWPTVGTWEVDTDRFPNGILGVSDYARANGMETIVWWEPERVVAGTWLATNHPDWIIGGAGGGLLNLGNPDAWNWLVNHVDSFMTAQGIEHYRQDFNMDPLGYWRSADASDRQGITENKHVVGYLAYWDELIRRKPNMMIDSCASGGHRNDLETLRRSVPLLRSDYIFDAVGEQCHSYGIWEWFPYTGTGFIDFNQYIFRSTMGPSTTLGVDTRRTDVNYALLRQLIAEWKQINDNFSGDFYRLTPYSTAENVWMGWQFDKPEQGKGMVQVFRRSGATSSSLTVYLKGLDPAATYTLTDMDTQQVTAMTGSQLMQSGLPVTIASQPGAALITYTRTVN